MKSEVGFVAFVIALGACVATVAQNRPTMDASQSFDFLGSRIAIL